MAAGSAVLGGAASGASVGGAIGSVVPGIGTAIGTGVGAAVGAGIAAYPYLTKSEAEKENERRLAELKMKQQMGTLGLTEREQQALYTKAADAAGVQTAQQQQIAKQYAAAGGASGAGSAIAGQLQTQENLARAQAMTSRAVEEQNLARKRELEQEIQARIAAQSESKETREQAIAGIAGAGFQAGAERLALESTIQGKKPSADEIAAVQKLYGFASPAEAAGFIEYSSRSPQTAKLAPYGNIASGNYGASATAPATTAPAGGTP